MTERTEMRGLTAQGPGGGGAKLLGLSAATLKATEWQTRAACIGRDPRLFDGPDPSGAARAICETCPVIAECRGLADQLAEEYAGAAHVHGTWGGTSRTQRIKESRPRPLKRKGHPRAGGRSMAVPLTPKLEAMARDGATLEEIAVAHGASPDAARRALIEYGLADVRRAAFERKRCANKLTPSRHRRGDALDAILTADVLEECMRRGESLNAIAARFGVSRDSVRERLRRRGLWS